MPITKAQFSQRSKRLGGSDVAAVIGVDPWRNAGDVWLEKTEQVKPAEPTPAMLAGTHFETAILDWASETLGPLTRNQYRSRVDLCLGTHADALTRAGNEPVEAKTAGLFGPLVDDWGDDGTDQVPEHVWAQAHAHMIVAPARVCHVPTFLGGRGFAMFRVDYDEEFGNHLIEYLPFWWKEYVATRTPPPDVTPHLDVLKRRFRFPGEPAEVADDLIEAVEAATNLRKAAVKAEEEAKAAVVAALGASIWGQSTSGRTVTYREQSARHVDSARLKAAGLYDEYVNVSTFPVLRFPKRTPKLMIKELMG
ncbi:MAG: YqaJ viral recombinase family protein [Verrucomicrobiota bacterium]